MRGDIIAKVWKERNIRIRASDRYVCLTDMAKAAGKLLADWNRLKGTNAYLEALSGSMGIPIDQLVQTNESAGSNDERGTWGHPKAAIRFAQWCSPEFAVQVDIWVDELLTQGRVELSSSEGQIQCSEIDKQLELARLRKEAAEAEKDAAIAKHNLSGQFNNMCALHGEAIALASIGQGDRVVDVEKPTIEVHSQEGEPFKGQTLSQLKTHLEKKYGVRFKSGAEIQRRLQALGRGDLVEYISRQVNQGAVSADKVEEAIALLTGGDRQMLLGEGGSSALVKRKPERARETAGSYA